MADLRFWEFVIALLAIFVFAYRSAGRLTPRIALAPILFPITRAPVLVAWAVGAIVMFGTIVLSAQSNGEYPFTHFALLWWV